MTFQRSTLETCSADPNRCARCEPIMARGKRSNALHCVSITKLKKAEAAQERDQNPTHECGKRSCMTRSGQWQTRYTRRLFCLHKGQYLQQSCPHHYKHFTSRNVASEQCIAQGDAYTFHNTATTQSPTCSQRRTCTIWHVNE